MTAPASRRRTSWCSPARPGSASPADQHLTPLSRKQTKTLLEGWLPVVLLATEQDGVRYEFTLWATPLPSVKNWRAAFDWPTEGDNFLNWVRVKATNPGPSPAEARVRLDLLVTNAPAADRLERVAGAGAERGDLFPHPLQAGRRRRGIRQGKARRSGSTGPRATGGA